MTPVTGIILLACIVGFALQYALFPWVNDHFALWPLGDSRNAPPFRPWQLVSHGFLHGSSTHLFTNMLALFMFGPQIERLIGRIRFLTYYIVCVITAGVAALLISNDGGVGASGGIFGLLLVYGLAFPKRKLMLLFPPIPMPAWLFVTLYGMLELYLGVSGREPDIGHFAHLGGMLGGFAMIMYWRSRGFRLRSEPASHAVN